VKEFTARWLLLNAAFASQNTGMTVSSDDTIAILRVELEGIEPLIWRRIAVRTSMVICARDIRQRQHGIFTKSYGQSDDGKVHQAVAHRQLTNRKVPRTSLRSLAAI